MILSYGVVLGQRIGLILFGSIGINLVGLEGAYLGTHNVRSAVPQPNAP